MQIHTIGDSHSKKPWIYIKKYKINIHDIISKRGPILMYSFGKDDLSRLNIKKIDSDIISQFELQGYDKEIKDGDMLIFCFGEPDCRAHIYKQTIKTNKGYKNIIDEVVKNYFNAIKLNVEQFKNLKVVVNNIVPAVKKKECRREDPTMPYLGTDNSRRDYVCYMNKKLKEYCYLYKYIFFDIHDKYSCKDGFLLRKYADGMIHIIEPKYYEEFLDKIFEEYKFKV